MNQKHSTENTSGAFGVVVTTLLLLAIIGKMIQCIADLQDSVRSLNKDIISLEVRLAVTQDEVSALKKAAAIASLPSNTTSE